MAEVVVQDGDLAGVRRARAEREPAGAGRVRDVHGGVGHGAARRLVPDGGAGPVGAALAGVRLHDRERRLQPGRRGGAARRGGRLPRHHGPLQRQHLLQHRPAVRRRAAAHRRPRPGRRPHPHHGLRCQHPRALRRIPGSLTFS